MKCPECNCELKVIEGSVKFTVQLADTKEKEPCCEMPEDAQARNDVLQKEEVKKDE